MGTTQLEAAICGMGLVTPFGIGIEPNARALALQSSALGELTLFDPPENGPEVVGEVAEFNVDDYVDTPKAYLDRSSEMMFAAMALALADAKIEPTSLAGTRTGLSFATTWGSAETLTNFFSDFLERGARRVKPFIFPHSYANTAISLAAMEHEFAGPHVSLSGAQTSGLQAVMKGMQMLQDDEADTVIAGAIDPLSPIRLQAGSPGSPMGEAAVLFVLRKATDAFTGCRVRTAAGDDYDFPLNAGYDEAPQPRPESMCGELASVGCCFCLAAAAMIAKGTIPLPAPQPRHIRVTAFESASVELALDVIG